MSASSTIPASASPIPAIFAEIQTLWGVPYVSAIHRTLAEWPGFLEWAWEAVAPVFRSGLAQEAGWRAAQGLSAPALDPIPPAALRVWGIDSVALGAVRASAEGFERVAPVNMMFAGLIKAIIEGQAPGGSGATRSWQAPSPLPEPPAMIDSAAVSADLRDTLHLFATGMDGKPFIPGLYRTLGHWPAFLAHLATALPPKIASTQTQTAFDTLRARIDAAVPGVLASLPRSPGRHPMPSSTEFARFLAVGQTYRKTSPELVVVGRMIREALPSTLT
jgi:hypothetical protein